MRSRCRLRRAGVCGSNVQFQEAAPVVSTVTERIEPVWGDTLDRGGCLLAVEILCGLPKRLGGGAIGWEESSRELYANEENERKATRVGSVSRGDDDVLN